MLVSIYYKLSLFNAHTVISIFHILMNVNKLCLNQSQNIQSPGLERVNPHPTHPQAPTNLLNSHHHWDRPLSKDCCSGQVIYVYFLVIGFVYAGTMHMHF